MMAQDQRQDIETQDDGSPFANPKLIAGAVALLLLLGFFLQNLQKVEINLLWFEWKTSLIWALLASAAFGFIAAWLLASVRARGARKREELLVQAELQRRKK